MSRRLFIDHTHTTQYGFQTGVQRVVRKICEHAQASAEGYFDEVIPVMLNEGRFVSSGKSKLTSSATNRAKEKRMDASSQRNWIQSIKHWLRSNHNRNSQWTSDVQATSLCEFVSGKDTLLLPDAYWALPHVWPAVNRFRNAGGRTAIVIYDLIPHIHSSIYGQEGANGFRAYIQAAFEHADSFYAISRTVRDQLVLELPKITGVPIGDLLIDYFGLGAEFTDPEGLVQSEVRNIFCDNEYARPLLMVGTIEARKNHDFVIDTMESLWIDAPERCLCIVGRPGWKGEQVIARMKTHPRFGKQLHWIDNASDADLLHCYKHAKGVVFSSIAEGFGLPIVESLWHRCRTFVSDIPIHREVGKNQCHYFDLNEKDSLLNLLRQFEKTDHQNSLVVGPQDHPPTTWNESVAGLVRKIHLSKSSPSIVTGRHNHNMAA